MAAMVMAGPLLNIHLRQPTRAAIGTGDISDDVATPTLIPTSPKRLLRKMKENDATALRWRVDMEVLE